MVEEQGRVVALADDGVWVETVRASSCQSCSARQGCGHSVLDRNAAGSRARILVVTDRIVSVGDQVVVGIPEGALMKGALMVYLLPLVCLFAGALLGSRLIVAGQDLSALLGVAGLAVGFLVNRWYSGRHAALSMQPSIIRVIPRPGM